MKESKTESAAITAEDNIDVLAISIVVPTLESATNSSSNLQDDICSMKDDERKENVKGVEKSDDFERDAVARCHSTDHEMENASRSETAANSRDVGVVGVPTEAHQSSIVETKDGDDLPPPSDAPVSTELPSQIVEERVGSGIDDKPISQMEEDDEDSPLATPLDDSVFEFQQKKEPVEKEPVEGEAKGASPTGDNSEANMTPSSSEVDEQVMEVEGGSGEESTGRRGQNHLKDCGFHHFF